MFETDMLAIKNIARKPQVSSILLPLPGERHGGGHKRWQGDKKGTY